MGEEDGVEKRSLERDKRRRLVEEGEGGGERAERRKGREEEEEGEREREDMNKKNSVTFGSYLCMRVWFGLCVGEKIMTERRNRTM